MSERAPGGDSAARRPLDQAALEQVGLVHILDRVLLLADDDGQGRQPDWAAFELLANRAQDVPIEAIQTLLVDLEQIECRLSRLRSDDTAAANLGVIAHALEQPVGHPRRTATAGGDGHRAVLLDRDPEQHRRAPDDPAELWRRVMLQPMLNPEPVPQGCGQQAGAGGGTDHRERWQLQRHHPRPGPLTDGDWQRAVMRLGESLEVRREIGDKGGSAWCLERLAEIAMAQGQAEKAIRVFGAASALRASIGSVMDPVDQPEYDAKLKSLREQLGGERFAAAWKEGVALTLEQAIALAMTDG